MIIYTNDNNYDEKTMLARIDLDYTECRRTRMVYRVLRD